MNKSLNKCVLLVGRGYKVNVQLFNSSDCSATKKARKTVKLNESMSESSKLNAFSIVVSDIEFIDIRHAIHETIP